MPNSIDHTNTLTHFDAKGQAHMVDVAAKAATHRMAIAQGRIVMNPATLAIILAGNAKKGDVLGIARVAAGVEMEALTAVQIALLTIYDMCKAVDRGMTITDVCVVEKHGGKSGSYVAGE